LAASLLPPEEVEEVGREGTLVGVVGTPPPNGAGVGTKEGAIDADGDGANDPESSLVVAMDGAREGANDPESSLVVAMDGAREGTVAIIEVVPNVFCSLRGSTAERRLRRKDKNL
jgi:hypothetical protein